MGAAGLAAAAASKEGSQLKKERWTEWGRRLGGALLIGVFVTELLMSGNVGYSAVETALLVFLCCSWGINMEQVQEQYAEQDVESF